MSTDERSKYRVTLDQVKLDEKGKVLIKNPFLATALIRDKDEVLSMLETDIVPVDLKALSITDSGEISIEDDAFWGAVSARKSLVELVGEDNIDPLAAKNKGCGFFCGIAPVFDGG
jgi:hypothetical protein